MCSHEAPCVRLGPTSDSQRRAGCPAYFIHSPSPKRQFLEEDYISRVQLDFTSETIKLGQDDAESTQHCCPGGSWAFDVGTIAFGASTAAPRPSNCICLQREAPGLSRRHHPRFETVSSCGLLEFPALVLAPSPHPLLRHHCPAVPASWASFSVLPPQWSLPLK